MDWSPPPGQGRTKRVGRPSAKRRRFPIAGLVLVVTLSAGLLVVFPAAREGPTLLLRDSEAIAEGIGTTTLFTPKEYVPLLEKPREAPAPHGPEFDRHYRWSYDDKEWEWSATFTMGAYEYYSDPVFRRGLFRYDYDAYVHERSDDAEIAALVQHLESSVAQEGYTDRQTIGFATAFVQSLPYTRDDVTTPYDDWPRFPLETLMDNGGDCEDTSILLASILIEMGYAAVLLSPPGHMAVGLLVDDRDAKRYDTATYQGRHYAYIETTGEGFMIGELPAAYIGETVEIIPL